MEEKYCERCGLYLGVVRPTRRYCSECKRKVDKERHKEHERAGVIFKPKKVFCAYCGKPMLKKVASQKYHNGCAKKAYNAKANLNAKAAYKIKQQEKKKLEKTFPSIGEVQALADKLGKHYGEVSQMLATGELTYER